LPEDTQTEKETLFPPKVLSQLFNSLLKELQQIQNQDIALETEQYVFESVLPLLENFCTMHTDYLKQILLAQYGLYNVSKLMLYRNEFGTVYELGTQ
jgi:hypothetical protein